mmetsp:Transcript_1819/g.1999  ORF Transcript_1819/g.1999 Transcript_1819/m.1999 type:complete len:422 (+) Transcript_1819:18-1283(+)
MSRTKRNQSGAVEKRAKRRKISQLRKASLPSLAGYEHLSDLDIVLTTEDGEEIVRVKTGRMTLALNSKFFNDELKDVTSGKYHYILGHNETEDSALALLDLLSSRDCTIKREVVTAVNTSMYTVVTNTLFYNDKDCDYAKQLFKHICSVCSFEELFYLKAPGNEECNLAFIQGIIRHYKTTSVLMQHCYDTKEKVILEDGVLDLMWKHYQEGYEEPYIDSSADVWLLACMARHYDLAERIEYSLPCVFAGYLWKRQEENRCWWISVWGETCGNYFPNLNILAMRSQSDIDNEIFQTLYTNTIVQQQKPLCVGKTAETTTSVTTTYHDGSFNVYIAGIVWALNARVCGDRTRTWVYPAHSDDILRVPYSIKFVPKSKALVASPKQEVTFYRNTDKARCATKHGHSFNTTLPFTVDIKLYVDN